MLDVCDVTFLVETGLEIAAAVKQHFDQKAETDTATAENSLQAQSQENN